MREPFWQSKTLDEMTDQEWESLCDGCGKCCLHKLIDEETDELYFTNVACNLLDLKQCTCRDYDNRFSYNEGCIKLTRKNLRKFNWLPKTCAYRLIYKGKSLPPWHPLITGSKKVMHENGFSVQNKAVYVIEVKDWEDHILNNEEQSKKMKYTTEQKLHDQ